MIALRRSLISIALLLIMVVPASMLAMAATPPPLVVSDDVSIHLSKATVNPGQMIWINVTTTYTNNTTCRLIVSEVASGKVVFSASGNISLIGTFRTIYTPRRPIGFGDYTVWATAHNASAFTNFAIEPSLQDLYSDLQKIANSDASTHRQMLFVWQVLLPYSFIVSAMLIGICYWLWRVPGGTKHELSQWLFTSLKSHKFRGLMTDIRGLNRKGYSARHVRTPVKTDLEIAALHQHWNQLEQFKNTVVSRRTQIRDRILNLNDFVQDITNLQNDINHKIKGKEVDLEMSIKIIEGKAFEKNKDNRQSNDVSKITPDRFKRLGAMNRMIRGGQGGNQGGGP